MAYLHLYTAAYFYQAAHIEHAANGGKAAFN
jgi:hypothetical protein